MLLKHLQILIILLVFNNIALGQKSAFEHDVIMVTNRLGDPRCDNYKLLKDSIAPNNELKYYLYHEENDSACCSRVTQLIDLKRLLDVNEDWVIYVHGYSRSFENAALRGLMLQKIYGVRLIVFSWPSKLNDKNGGKNLRKALKNVEDGIGSFKKFLLEIQAYREKNNWPKNNKNLSLFLHSMGNYYIETGVNKGIFEQLEPNLFDNIIINAAAVNQDKHPEWLNKLDIQKKIYVTSNKHDFILNGFRIFSNRGKLLGERIKPPVSSKANYVNFSKSIGMTIPHYTSHNYFIGKPVNESENIRTFYHTILSGRPANLSDKKIFRPRKNDTGYNIVF